ncbi:hypothetical protein SAMN02799630_00214 [Paenibacillus sp. UNCCL117]|nr:hypothetical protein SAMN04488602_102318 [Paenibacillus sp. cl123]SFW11988.1 hypothetical protein SAMN02799630_00214 [Paenibacillus sp. UNCCL117]
MLVKSYSFKQNSWLNCEIIKNSRGERLMRPDFDEIGFLGQQIDDIMESYLKENTDVFELIEEISLFGNQAKYKLNVQANERRFIASASLYLKVLNCFQSTIILAKKGLGVECAILTRSLLEAVFPLKIMSSNKEFTEEFFGSNHKSMQLKWLNAIFTKDTFINNRTKANEELREILQKEKLEDKIRDFKVEELASRADMESYYQYVYRVLSDDVHTTPFSLYSYINTDNNDNIVSFNNGPITRDLKDYVLTSASIVLIALESISEIFDLNFDDKIKCFDDRISKIWQ